MMQPVAPGSTIGILGGGQLGRMLAQAAARMGYRTHIYCPDKDAPAFDVTPLHSCAAYEDEAALKSFADSVDVITYEFENIPTSGLAVLGDKLKPGIKILDTCQHRVKEKETLQRLGIGTAPFAPVTNNEELAAAMGEIATPGILKTCTMGYDGKGQWKYETGSAPELPADGEYIYEGLVLFSKEISVIVARNAHGDIQCYDPVENEHKNHILHTTTVPANILPSIKEKAINAAITIAKGLELTGLMAVEMFVTGDNDVLVNELAPRPHNSGHWTMDAAITSQFEQTIRAICGLPLGNTAPLCNATMLNLIGEEVNDWPKYVAMANAKLHLYGKKETRPGRKMGHVTFLRHCEER